MVVRIRELAREEWSLLRELRLAALTDAPDQFGETRLVASQRSAEEWISMTCSNTPGTVSSTFIAEVGNAAVGMAFAIQDRIDATTGRLGGLRVQADARGVGVGLALARAVVAWSSSAGMRRLRLWVVPNTAAARLYRRANFIPTGVQQPFPGDDSRSVHEMQLDFGDAG